MVMEFLFARDCALEEHLGAALGGVLPSNSLAIQIHNRI
jgi:hypothetical protein